MINQVNHGRVIRLMLAIQGMTQANLSAASGINPAMISHLTNRLKPMTVEYKLRIAAVFNITPADWDALAKPIQDLTADDLYILHPFLETYDGF